MSLRRFMLFGGGSSAPAPTYIVAEGGVVTRDPLDLDYVIHTFSENDTFIVLSNLGGYEVIAEGIGGGGSGGGSNNGGAGGGGAGGVETRTFVPTVRSYAVVIGARGESTTASDGLPGGDTTFETISGLVTCVGGGGGGSGNGSSNGNNGGSGSGGGYLGTVRGLGTSGQGNNGGLTTGDGGAGGGGSETAGGNSTGGESGTNGGNGRLSIITGLRIAPGGGGGAFGAGTPGTGGLNGGGNGGAHLQNGADADQAVPGSGGGGAGGGVGSRSGGVGTRGRGQYRFYSPAPIDFFNLITILSDAS